MATESTGFGPGGLRRPRLVIPRELYRASNRFGALGVASIFTILFACLAASGLAVEAGAWWAFVLIVPVLGAYVYKLTIVLHECAHRTLFSSRRANRLIGHACAGLLGVSAGGFADSHWQHHRHCGTDDETGESDYLRLEGASPLGMVLHLLKPLSGLSYVEALREYLRPSPSTAAGGGSTRVVDIGWILAMQAIVILVSTGGGRVWAAALVYPLTAATFGLFFSRVRAFSEHVSATRAAGQCSVRSHMPNAFDRVFFYTLNMNLHVEHHLFPQVPACHLWTVRRLLSESGCLEPEMTSTSILGTITGQLRAARRRGGLDRPGVSAT